MNWRIRVVEESANLLSGCSVSVSFSQIGWYDSGFRAQLGADDATMARLDNLPATGLSCVPSTLPF
jgi:hypothetical protein